MKLFNLIRIELNSHRYVKDLSKRLRLRELYDRRMEIGPEKPRRRSEFVNWNYNAEIFAFSKRLGEDFNLEVLKEAFIDKSIVDTNNNIKSNEELMEVGFKLAEDYVKKFLCYHFQYAPVEWIVQIKDYLLSTEIMGKISGHLGTRDLIMSSSVEVQLEAESDALFAIIGALLKSQDSKRAHGFIKDFILTQLTQVHLCDIIKIHNPFQLLVGVLRYHKYPDPESRLLRQSGPNSVFACHHVGIYSDKQLLGEAAGESVGEAEREALCQSLRNLFGMSESKSAIDFQSEFDENIPIPNLISEQHYLNLAILNQNQSN